MTTGMSLKSIAVWWERKRLVYNLVMLVAGGLGTTLIYSDVTPPQVVLGILCYGIGANLAYTLAPVVDMYLLWIWDRDLGRIRRWAFAVILGLSVGVTLLCIMAIALSTFIAAPM